jgi:hypothetical protein
MISIDRHLLPKQLLVVLLQMAKVIDTLRAEAAELYAYRILL